MYFVVFSVLPALWELEGKEVKPPPALKVRAVISGVRKVSEVNQQNSPLLLYQLPLLP